MKKINDKREMIKNKIEGLEGLIENLDIENVQYFFNLYEEFKGDYFEQDDIKSFEIGVDYEEFLEKVDDGIEEAYSDIRYIEEQFEEDKTEIEKNIVFKMLRTVENLKEELKDIEE